VAPLWHHVVGKIQYGQSAKAASVVQLSTHTCNLACTMYVDDLCCIAAGDTTALHGAHGTTHKGSANMVGSGDGTADRLSRAVAATSLAKRVGAISDLPLVVRQCSITSRACSLTGRQDGITNCASYNAATYLGNNPLRMLVGCRWTTCILQRLHL
jgi:hypothetical protein